jgi:GMP synthase (glutamine-hydrolysing)
MKVLIVKNVPGEGPGTIEDHLRKEMIPYSVIDLQSGDAAPRLDAFTHLVILGGPMAVYEMKLSPHLAREADLIRAAIGANKQIMGVCLGAQMLAHVLGARVYPGSGKEIGWYEVALSGEGMGDPLMSALALPDRDAAQVFQWHGDTFDLPAGSVRLASSDRYANQAFRYGERAYGLQFHIEVTPAMVRDWLVCEQGIDYASILLDSERLFVSHRQRAAKFYGRFFGE